MQLAECPGSRCNELLSARVQGMMIENLRKSDVIILCVALTSCEDNIKSIFARWLPLAQRFCGVCPSDARGLNCLRSCIVFDKL